MFFLGCNSLESALSLSLFNSSSLKGFCFLFGTTVPDKTWECFILPSRQQRTECCFLHILVRLRRPVWLVTVKVLRKLEDKSLQLYRLKMDVYNKPPSPCLRRRCCCGDGDAQTDPRSHIPVVPAASSGHHETGARRRADLISSRSRFTTHSDRFRGARTTMTETQTRPAAFVHTPSPTAWRLSL